MVDTLCNDSILRQIIVTQYLRMLEAVNFAQYLCHKIQNLEDITYLVEEPQPGGTEDRDRRAMTWAAEEAESTLA